MAVLISLMIGTSQTQATDEVIDVPWPREFRKGDKRLTVYQPQVDSWRDYTDLKFRCAISIGGVLKEERIGIVEAEAKTVVDHVARLVAIAPGPRTIRLPGVSEADAVTLRAAVEELNPSYRVLVMSLDRVLACVDASKLQRQRTTALNLEPPRIYYSADPAILVMFMGKPKFKPIVADKPDLQFAVNTNWDVVHDTADKQYYLLDGDGWITASDPIYGSWTPTKKLPAGMKTLPADENWTEVRKCIPGKPAPAAPKVIVATEPAELIVTEGAPVLSPIQNTAISRVTNSQSVLFRHGGDNKFYFLAAGRWFSADSPAGPWAAASGTLPPDFAAIPPGDPSAFVRASVPGTQEAQDAVLMASVPNTTVVKLDEKPVQVVYSGEPKFVVVEGAQQVQFAVNTSNSVFLVGGKYYCCEQGVWFEAASANGPWSFCRSVPQVIYTIPPSNPHYNVTYVVVQSSTPTTVTYSQTAGYSGEFVAATGVLMFGAGVLVGAILADDDHYYPPYPCHYSYGCGAVYHHGYGGYYGAAHAYYGPYGGVGHAAAYNPRTGTYARSASAYGPYGSARVQSAYNPYTGASAARAQVNTARGSAGVGAAYNPSTGNYARGAYASGQYGSAAAIQTSFGSAAGWSTKNSQGVAVKNNAGDIYATNGDTVYKKDSNGNWSSNSGSGWESPTKPQPKPQASAQASSARPNTAQPNTAQPQAAQAHAGPASAAPRGAAQPSAATTSLESEARARQRGEQTAKEASTWKSSGGAGSGERFGSSGGSRSSSSGGSRSGSSRGGRSGGGGRR